MADARRMDQLFVLLYRMNENPPALPASDAEMMERHKAFLQGLLDRKLITTAGPMPVLTLVIALAGEYRLC